jgi:hypothetical protein
MAKNKYDTELERQFADIKKYFKGTFPEGSPTTQFSFREFREKFIYNKSYQVQLMFEIYEAFKTGEIDFRRRLAEKYGLTEGSLGKYVQIVKKELINDLEEEKDDLRYLVKSKLVNYVNRLEEQDNIQEAGKMVERLINLLGLDEDKTINVNHQTLQIISPEDENTIEINSTENSENENEDND